MAAFVGGRWRCASSSEAAVRRTARTFKGDVFDCGGVCGWVGLDFDVG